MAGADFIDPREPDKLFYPMRVVAQDQTVLDADGNPLLATIMVPSNRFAPGPRTHRFQVIDYDTSTGRLREPPKMKFPPAAAEAGPDRASWGYIDSFDGKKLTEAQLAGDTTLGRRFRCQNVYAIAARTLAKFESALGRRLPWGFGDSHELYLVPHAFHEANAYYSREDNAVLFGYVDDVVEGTERRIYTCLSHDIVAHEITHALLDGLRPGFMKPGLADQIGFHEAFADIVALLSIFGMEETVAKLLGDADADGRIPVEMLDPDLLRRENPLFGLAEDLGEFLGSSRGNGLRRSVDLSPDTPWETAPEFREPHRRGEVLVAAIMRTMVEMWIGRIQALVTDRRTADVARVAEEGAKSASHLLKMAIRAIDYAPPIEFEFSDFLAAIIKSDTEVAPMDDKGYRRAVVDEFGRFRITADERQIHDLAERAPLYSGLNFDAMQSQRDEVYRFIWGNAAFLGLDPDYHINVDDVRASTRVGPDGLIVEESIATYTQSVDAQAREIAALSKRVGTGGPLRVPRAVANVGFKIYGGGTLIFDQFGRLKYHHPKPLFDWNRQQRRLDHLVRTGVQDSRGRFGFSVGAKAGQAFAGLHVSGDRAGEDW